MDLGARSGSADDTVNACGICLRPHRRAGIVSWDCPYVARRVAIDMPMLMLIKKNGAEEQGWRGTPFYWPVIWAPQNIQTAIFAHETTP